MKYTLLKLLALVFLVQAALGLGTVIAIDRSIATLHVIIGIYIASQMVFSFLLLVNYQRTIHKALSLLSKAMNQVVNNKDLTTEVPACGSKKMVGLLTSFNELVSSFDETLVCLRSSIARLEPMSRELADTNMGLNQRNVIQKNHNLNIARILQEVEVTSDSMATSVSQIMDVSKASDKQIQESLFSVKESYDSIHHLATETESATKITTKLHESSREIGNVVTMINTIAEQTNLLALNAAIEAARAGEAGRGFSVVADEVRNLSIKTQESTLKIEDMIKVIQVDVDNVMHTMQESRSVSETSVENIDKVKKHFDIMHKQITDITEKSTAINSSISLQRASISHVVVENNEMNLINEDIVNFTKDSAISEKDLINLGNYMSKFVEQFSLSQNEYDTSMRAKKKEDELEEDIIDTNDDDDDVELF